MKDYFDRYFATVWFLLSVLAVFFWLIIKQIFSWEDLINYSAYSCLLYLIYNSRSIRSKNAPIYLIGNFLFIVGIFLKIMHWPYSHELMIVSLLIIFAGYIIFFYKHTAQNWLDILKLSWIGISALTIIWVLLKLPYPYIVENITLFIFWPIYFGVAWYEAKGIDQSIELQNNKLEAELPEDIL